MLDATGGALHLHMKFLSAFREAKVITTNNLGPILVREAQLFVMGNDSLFRCFFNLLSLPVLRNDFTPIDRFEYCALFRGADANQLYACC